MLKKPIVSLKEKGETNEEDREREVHYHMHTCWFWVAIPKDKKHPGRSGNRIPLTDHLDVVSHMVARKPLLTDTMLCKMLAFWSVADWQKVLWSNKRSFQVMIPIDCVWCPLRCSQYKPRYTIITVKHSSSIKIWGCFSRNVQRCRLYFLPKNVTMNGTATSSF